MHSMQEEAIILKTKPRTQAVVFFSPHYGKAIGYLSAFKHRSLVLAVGSLHVLSLKKERNALHIVGTELLQIPVYTTVDTLFWYQHLLELYDLFIPEHAPDEALFSYAKQITSLHQVLPGYAWRYVLIGFFYFLGEPLPEHIRQAAHLFHDLLTTYEQENVRLRHELARKMHHTTEIEVWILDLLQKHPGFSSLKTMQFIHYLYPRSSNTTT